MQPIIVFDSGMGGWSVLEAVQKFLPEEAYVYVSDYAGLPYGTKDEHWLIERVLKVIKEIHKKFNPRLVVIACNTASTLTLSHLRSHFSFPIVGVVPAIKPAAQYSQNKSIGLLATPATIQNIYTLDLIEKFAPSCNIIRVGSVELVQMAENYLRGVPVDLSLLSSILHPFWSTAKPIDTLVLGCTHFPLLASFITATFPYPIRLVDSSKAIAKRVEQLLVSYETEKLFSKKVTVVFTAQTDKQPILLAHLKKRGMTDWLLLPIV